MTDEALEALRAAAGGAARVAGDGDAIAGVPARYVAEPGSTAEAAQVVRAAVAHDLSLPLTAAERALAS